MVYSPELGYDPNEWEECSDDKTLPVVVLFGLSMFSRACIGIGTILLAGLFLWYIEANKRKNHNKEKDENEFDKKKLQKVSSEDEEDFSAETILEMASKEAGQKARTERRSSSKRKLSADEINELMAWKAEVHRLEQERLRAASQEPEHKVSQQHIDDTASLDDQQAPLITIASTSTETATTVLERFPQQQQQQKSSTQSTATPPLTPSSSILVKQQEGDEYSSFEAKQKEQKIQKDIPIHQIQPQVEIKSTPLSRDIPEREAQPKAIDQLHIKSCEFIGETPGKTPTSTPQDGVPLVQKLPELAAHYRKMADQLTQKLLSELDEIGGMGGSSYETADPAMVTAVLQNRYRSDINEGLAETGAPQDVQQHLARQLDVHVASIVVRELRRRSSTTALLKLEQQQKEQQQEKEYLLKNNEEENLNGGGGPILKKHSSSSDDNGFVKIGLPIDNEDETPAGGDSVVVIVSSQEASKHQKEHSLPISSKQQQQKQNQKQQQFLLLQPISSNQNLSSGGSITTDDDDDEEEYYDDRKEEQTNIRISLFDGDGMSTTADDIEFVPSSQTNTTQQIVVETKNNKTINQQQQEQNQHHPLNAEEAKQVAALLQEYELTPKTSTTINIEEQNTIENEQKQIKEYSEKIKTTGGDEIISESAKQTPGGSFSIPESPASLGFDIISFPQSPIEKETVPNETIIVQNIEINLNIQQNKQNEQNQEQQKLATVVFPSSQSQIASTNLQQQQTNVVPSSPQTQQTAEALLQEAIDYMQKQEGQLPQLREQQQQKQKRISLRQSGEFVMEEEMLESEEIAAGGLPIIIHSKQRKSTNLNEIEKNLTIPALSQTSQKQGLLVESTAGGEGSTPGADGTSKQIATNEVFDKPDAVLLFDDGDDKDIDVTYAPEIQSMEVPPDSLSQADSLNLVDENFSEHQEIAAITTLKRQLSEPKQTSSEIPPPKPPRTSLHFEENEIVEIMKKQKVEENSENIKEEENQNIELNREIEQIIILPTQQQKQTLSEKHYQQQEQQKIIFPDQKQNPQAPQFLLTSFNTTDESTSSLDTTSIKHSSLLSVVGVTSTQEMLLKLQSLEALSEAMRKAGLESSNLIFGIDYTASNKYQGERSFSGRSLHSVDEPEIENPYQQVIKIMGRTLAPFAGTEHGIPAFGFGDASTGDWSVFPLNGKPEGECNDLDDVLRIYNKVTPNVDLSGPTNFAPLIYRSMEICFSRKDYHILVIIADGQVTNEKATKKAIVSACSYPLSIIVVGVGDGPWDMMKVFDESLPKRPWDNFHFVEFNSLFNDENDIKSSSNELKFAINSLLEIPDQYNIVRKLGMLLPSYYFNRRAAHHRSPRSHSPPKLTLAVSKQQPQDNQNNL